MLNSMSARHPDGVANSNGLLGQHLTEHVSGVSAIGLRAGECDGASELYMPNFRNRNGNTEKFLRGYGIQGYIKPGPGRRRPNAPWSASARCYPGPSAVSVFGDLRDRVRPIPAPRIDCRFSDNELEMAHDQAQQAAQLLGCAGFDVTALNGLSPPGYSMHEGGTARMGAGSEDIPSLNSHNQCWEVPNLFVTDGAAFPSVGFQNPTLTMMAITGRACGYILKEFQCGAW